MTHCFPTHRYSQRRFKSYFDPPLRYIRHSPYPAPPFACPSNTSGGINRQTPAFKNTRKRWTCHRAAEQMDTMQQCVRSNVFEELDLY